MDLQIENLLEKYWKGETSIAEEKLVKEYFKTNPGQSTEAHFFGKLETAKSEKPIAAFNHPGKSRRLTWLSIAAAILIGLMTIPFIFNDETKQDQFAIEDPKEAFEITRASLMMVSEGLNKGKTYSNELNKINKAKTIINN